jgi:hypothetical protein
MRRQPSATDDGHHPQAVRSASCDTESVHRPSISPGVSALIWAVVLGLFVWWGLIAVGFHDGTAFVLGLLAMCGIFVFVRLCGSGRPGALK